MSFARFKNSTNVRAATLQRLIPLAVGALDTVAPPLAARWAEDIFRTPPPPFLSERGRQFLQSGQRFDVSHDRLRLAAWRWGDERARTVVLYHGWGGRSTQMSAFVDPLVARGFAVVAMDAPAHGASEGRRSSLVEFADALRALSNQIGTPHAVVAHSMGGSATALAIHRGLDPTYAVFIGSPASPSDYTRNFAARHHLRAATLRLLRDRLASRLRLHWNELDVTFLAPRMQVPLLVVHDVNDDDVPPDNGQRIVERWPGARLHVTGGLGHRRILRDASVVNAIADFIRD